MTQLHEVCTSRIEQDEVPGEDWERLAAFPFILQVQMKGSN
jgi:hypothetical protein